ncbi:MAG: phosphoglycerate kinase [Nitrospinota bacterium]
MNKLSIDQVKVNQKTLFIRVDFNAPIEDGKVTDNTRIKAAIPTIEYAIKNGAKVILASHLGRPDGEKNQKFSLRQIVSELEELLGKSVTFIDDSIGPKVKEVIASKDYGDVLLLENLRFYKEEKANQESFAKELASLADIYVNDAFGAAHRSHASIEGITKFIPQSVSGFLLKAEIDYFQKGVANAAKPLAIVIGGAKVSTKLNAINNLIGTADILLIGGAMAFTFLHTLGFEIGKNLAEKELASDVEEILKSAAKSKTKLYLPVDFLIANSIEDATATDLVTYQELPEDKLALDIGPATIALFKLALNPAKTILFNGPMGLFENSAFAAGTFAICHTISESDALTVVGGGDSVSALKSTGLDNKIDHISTGGGAFLELLEGKELPGIAALTDQ